MAILLMGPTASGKTDLAVDLVQRLPCEIVSVDSAMVYRGMDIGTAKPGPEVRARAPHRLIDILEPTEAYSTARFRSDALAHMASIARVGRIPLLVGGTMLYFRGLQQGLARLPDADPGVREALLGDAARIGWPAMHGRLAVVDPEAAARIHPNDPQRIQRALEIHVLTGVAMSRLLREPVDARLPYRLLKLVRAPEDRGVLHQRIEQRFRSMIESGLLVEVEGLWGRGDLTPDLPSMRCVGYRQVLKYILGEYSWDEMVLRAIYATRQLAKRQITWLRAEADCNWLGERCDALAQAQRLVERVM